MTTSANSLAGLLGDVSLDDHEENLNAANAALRKSKTDIAAQHVKAVALLKLDRYDDAVEHFEQAGNNLKERAWFEYAYALYRTGYSEKAVQVAEAHSGGRGMLHLLAQAEYRRENFEKSANAYRQLSEQLSEAQDEEYDLRINSSAVDAQKDWLGQNDFAQRKKLGREDLEVFETAYNAACGSIARGELAQAEVCLRRAKDLCNALTELSEAEKKAEILPISVQQVFVLIQLGRLDEAEQLMTMIPFAEIKEPSTKFVAEINSTASMQAHSNPYLSTRLFHSMPRPPKSDHLFSVQSDILRQDELVLNLMCHKYDGVARSTHKYISKHPSPTTSSPVNSAGVLHAAAHSRNATGKAALKAILPLLERHSNDVGLILTIANLYILTNNYAAATHLLEAFFKRLEQSTSPADLDVRFAPGLVATLATLYTVQGRHAHSKNELAKTATYWRHKSKSPPKALMTAAGAALLESQNPEDLASAGELFASLHAQDKTDAAGLAGLVAAYAINDPSKLNEDLVESLPPVARLISDIDAAALEASGVAIPTSLGALPASRKRSAEKTKPQKPSKIRKKRMPKDFDPNKKMDPERWLPMRDRSYYRPKGKKGKKRAEGLTQGGAVVEEKVAAEGKPTPVAQQKKKKGKGKGGKW
ncbi:signal recognition particle protein-like protein [Delitschia confertaspora ATCC 74209]|uniref:Signal recognition particle subunit SRP72 n=1 Tax=Delitschia confertaspora ATCC 74209 TaxID=1513339 RepID=A0A9P4JMF2_9PLEO|nr:signal recognition particle protein-like protein [Delitschia confertaspora ATCC 74209]